MRWLSAGLAGVLQAATGNPLQLDQDHDLDAFAAFQPALSTRKTTRTRSERSSRPVALIESPSVNVTFDPVLEVAVAVLCRCERLPVVRVSLRLEGKVAAAPGHGAGGEPDAHSEPCQVPIQ